MEPSPLCPKCGYPVHCGGDAHSDPNGGKNDWLHTPAHGGPECGHPLTFDANFDAVFAPYEKAAG